MKNIFWALIVSVLGSVFAPTTGFTYTRQHCRMENVLVWHYQSAPISDLSLCEELAVTKYEGPYLVSSTCEFPYLETDWFQRVYVCEPIQENSED